MKIPSSTAYYYNIGVKLFSETDNYLVSNIIKTLLTLAIRKYIYANRMLNLSRKINWCNLGRLIRSNKNKYNFLLLKSMF